MKKQANQSKKSFNPTPIPYRTKSGEPMAYYTLSDDGKTHTEVSRAECLARTEEPKNPFPQRWYVDEESGLVVRLLRNQKGEELARNNMRSIWREQKHQERKFQCVWKGTNKCDQKCETCNSRTSRTVELDKPLGNDSDGSDTFYEPADPTDITEILEQKAVLDTSMPPLLPSLKKTVSL